MNRKTLFALAGILALTGCKNEPTASPDPTSKKPAEEAAQPSDTQPVTGQLAADQPSEAAPKLPTAAEVIALIDKATRIEAKTSVGQEPAWSKDLTPEDVANLKAGIGEAELSPHAPRCLPTVMVTLYEQDKELGKIGAFCDGADLAATGPMRFDINESIGSFIPRDRAKINAALESPVDI